MSTTLTSREFNQDTSRAKRAAEDGPVIITDRGRPSHVLLSYENYERLAGRKVSLLEAIGTCDDDMDFEPPRLRDEKAKPADFG
jgi:prevent-host-death family protein